MVERPVVVLGADGGLGREIMGLGRERGHAMVPVTRDAIDLNDSNAASQLIASMWDEIGPFSGLVHAAGIYPASTLFSLEETSFDEVMAINTRSFLEASRTAGRLARECGSRLSIVAVSSGAAGRARPGTGVYAASKAALEAIVRGIALEGASVGIRCNAVAPGYVSVNSRTNPIPEEYERALLANAPSGRLGAPRDIAPTVLWFLNEDSNWVTGQILQVDGGAALGPANAPNWLQ